MNRKDKGQKGEIQAVSYLIKNNIKILERNYNSKFGEIDIIGLKKKIKKLVFYEVKYRENDYYGNVGYSIDNRKKQKMLKTAMYYLIQNQKYKDYDISFDAILIEKKQFEV